MYKITGYIEKDPETGLYVGIVPGIPGAHTQAKTLDELRDNTPTISIKAGSLFIIFTASCSFINLGLPG